MASWIPAYNTNGFAHHRLEDVVKILHELGYEALALTLDVHHLDPFLPSHREDCAALRAMLQERGMRVVIESGARFNLDARRKHYPSLLSREDGVRRADFLKRCHETAVMLGADCVSFWSGHNFDGLPDAEAWGLLAERIAELSAATAGSGVAWAVEPEPGMFLETLDHYDQLLTLLPGDGVGLALDLGHLLVTQEREPAAAIRQYAGRARTMAIEDMKRGIHDHLPFGDGDMDFPPVFEALAQMEWEGILSVELSRSSSTAPTTAAAAAAFLRNFRNA